MYLIIWRKKNNGPLEKQNENKNHDEREKELCCSESYCCHSPPPFL